MWVRRKYTQCAPHAASSSAAAPISKTFPRPRKASRVRVSASRAPPGSGSIVAMHERYSARTTRRAVRPYDEQFIAGDGFRASEIPTYGDHVDEISPPDCRHKRKRPGEPVPRGAGITKARRL